MRTLEGMQALDAAKRYGLTLYDKYYENEVSVAEAQQFIESRRDPSSFILKDWPDTEEEAEDIVLMRIYRAMNDERKHSGLIEEIMDGTEGPKMNLAAAELAALRLGTRKILEVQDREDGVFYHVPRSTHLTREFLSKLSEFVCDECAHLRMDGAFHETCLHNLIDAIRRGQYAFEDIVEERVGEGEERGITRLLKPGLGRLSQRVNETKSRWQSLLMGSKQASAPAKGATRSQPTEPDPDWPNLHEPPEDVVDSRVRAEISATDHVERATVVSDEVVQPPRSDVVSATYGRSQIDASRVKITKRDLLTYLEGIEIVDESGDLAASLTAYEQECEVLEARLAAERRARSETERDRDYWKDQFEDLKTDMDKLVEALQIAQRRTEKDRPI